MKESSNQETLMDNNEEEGDMCNTEIYLTDENEKRKPKEYNMSKYRWISMLSFAFLYLILGVSYAYFVPIAGLLALIYEKSQVLVNCIFVFFNAPSVLVGIFLSNYIIAKKGTKVSTLIGSIFIILGLISRILVYYNFYFLLIGCFLLGAGCPFIENAISKVSSNWFNEKQRVFSTTVIMAFNKIGEALGYILPMFFMKVTVKQIKDAEKGSQEYEELIAEGKQEVFKSGLDLGAIFTIITIIAFLLYKNKPKNPPSPTAEQDKEKKKAIWENIKKLLTNKNFMILAAAYTVMLQSLKFLTPSLSIIFATFNFTEKDVSYIGVTEIVMGQVGLWVVGVLLNKTKKYKKLFIWMTLISFCFLAGLLFSLNLNGDHFWVVLIFDMGFGFIVFAIVLVCLEFGCEIAFPVGEGGIAVFLFSINGFLAIPVTLLSAFFYEVHNQFRANVSFCAICVVYVLGIFIFSFTKENLKRIHYDRRKSSIASFEDDAKNTENLEL